MAAPCRQTSKAWERRCPCPMRARRTAPSSTFAASPWSEYGFESYRAHPRITGRTASHQLKRGRSVILRSPAVSGLHRLTGCLRQYVFPFHPAG
jgi:hypothetical protein